MYGGITDDAAATIDLGLARLELRLDKRDNPGLRRDNKQGSKHGQDQAQRDERDIDHHALCGFGQGREVPNIGAFHHDDAWIVAQGPRQLSMPDINGIDAGCAAFQ